MKWCIIGVEIEIFDLKNIRCCAVQCGTTERLRSIKIQNPQSSQFVDDPESKLPAYPCPRSVHSPDSGACRCGMPVLNRTAPDRTREPFGNPSKGSCEARRRWPIGRSRPSRSWDLLSKRHASSSIGSRAELTAHHCTSEGRATNHAETKSPKANGTCTSR